MPKVEILKQKGHNFLWIDDYLWMYDIPIERQAQKEISDLAYGDVLVAGYGLGLVQSYLNENSAVTSVTTIELLPEVIQAVQLEYGMIYGKIIIGDFYEFQTHEKYDCVIGDIWKEVAPEFLEEYKRYEEKAKTFVKPNGKILGWGKEFFDALNHFKNCSV